MAAGMRGVQGDDRMSDLTAVSLFAGIGGFDEALRRAGVKVAAAVEIDEACRGVLAHRFPETHLFNDVTEVTGDQLRAAGFVPGRGIITGGWPCQGNSVAGRRKGMADPRSGLWRHVVRLLAETRPRWFIGENVPGLLSINGGRDFGTVIRDLDDLGYGVAWRVLDAQWFGLAQRRKRLFVAACLGDGSAPVEVLLEPEGGERDPAAGREAGTDVAGTLGSRAGGSRTTDLDGHGAHVVGALATTGPGGGRRVGADEAAASQLVVATLQGGGRRGHRIDAEGAAGGHLIAHAITAREGKGPDSDLASGFVAVPVALRGRNEGSSIEVGNDGDPSFAIRTPGGGSSYPMVATSVTGSITHTLTAEGADASEDGTGRSTPLVAIPVDLRNAARETQAGDTAGVGLGEDGDPSCTLSATGRALPGVATMAFNWRTGGDGRLGYGEKPTAPHSAQAPAILAAVAVRRLTPLECERLQGFPDDWTRWLADGTEQSDSARYRQCGNAVAVPVVEWITRRVVAVSAARQARSEAAA
jgi:DNA (cytosine-5)-methyltransferase 1